MNVASQVTLFVKPLYIHDPSTQVGADRTFEQKLKNALDLSTGSEPENQDAVTELTELASYPVTVALLSQTGAGGQLAKLSQNHPDSEVREAATATSAAWRSTIISGQLGHYLQQRGNVSIPSSSCAGLLPVYTRES